MTVIPSKIEDEAVLNTYLGQRVRIARIALGVSQQALADRLGLTFQQVQKYERGRNRISASRLFDIARVLGIGIEAFYDGLEEGARGPLPSRINDLTEAYEKLSPQFGARELVELNQAFVRIPGNGTREKIIQLAELLAECCTPDMAGESALAEGEIAAGKPPETAGYRRAPAKLEVA